MFSAAGTGNTSTGACSKPEADAVCVSRHVWLIRCWSSLTSADSDILHALYLHSGQYMLHFALRI